MDKTILPAKYIDCVKTLVYVDGKYQLSLNFNNVIAISYYYESTSKKGILQFLRDNVFYIPRLNKAKYANKAVNLVNKYRNELNMHVQVFYNLETNHFICYKNTCNSYVQYDKGNILLVNTYYFRRANKLTLEELKLDTLLAIKKYFC